MFPLLIMVILRDFFHCHGSFQGGILTKKKVDLVAERQGFLWSGQRSWSLTSNTPRFAEINTPFQMWMFHDFFLEIMSRSSEASKDSPIQQRFLQSQKGPHHLHRFVTVNHNSSLNDHRVSRQRAGWLRQLGNSPKTWCSDASLEHCHF